MLTMQLEMPMTLPAMLIKNFSFINYFTANRIEPGSNGNPNSASTTDTLWDYAVAARLEYFRRVQSKEISDELTGKIAGRVHVVYHHH